MNYLDVILATPLLWGLYKGFSKGIINAISRNNAELELIFKIEFLRSELNFEIALSSFDCLFKYDCSYI